MFVNEAGTLKSFFPIIIFQYDPISLSFSFLINPSFTIRSFLYLFPFYLLSTMLTHSWAMCDVVKMPTVPDEEVLVISEDELEAFQNVWLSGYKWLWCLISFWISFSTIKKACIWSWARYIMQSIPCTTFPRGIRTNDLCMEAPLRTGWITVLLSADLNSDASSKTILLDDTESRKFVKSGRPFCDDFVAGINWSCVKGWWRDY